MSQNFKILFPNILTISRGFFVVVISILFFTDLSYKFPIIYVLFLLAGISDYFDGKLARKWKVKSNFGIVFDSLFDKVLTFAMYVLLIPYNLIHPNVFVVLITRDLLIDGIKNFSLSKGVPIPARFSGKIKMVCQTLMINFALLVLVFPHNSLFKNCLSLFVIAAIVFSLFSGFLYLLDWLTPPSKAKTKKHHQ